MFNTTMSIQVECLNMTERSEQELELNKWQYLCYHGRTMIMMWKATGDKRYLQLAKSDLRLAKSIKEVGFIRPLGAISNKAA